MEIRKVTKNDFLKDLEIDAKDPIFEEWERTGKEKTWETYLKDRNEEAQKNGFESAYDEYYSTHEEPKKSYAEKEKSETDREPTE